MDQPRLYRSRTNRVLGGVCGGLGVYLNVDPTLIRLLFLLLIFGSEFGALLYILLWIVIPEEGRELSPEERRVGERFRAMGEDIQQAVARPHPQAGVLVGAGLIIVGGLLFIERLELPWLIWLKFDILWPVFLIAAGIALLIRQMRKA